MNNQIDERIERMQYLLNYDNSLNENKKSTGVEFSKEGADGKTYGILREGSKYYVKCKDQTAENIRESYDYIGGYMNKKSYEYKSYNAASKGLDRKIASLNEAYNVHSTANVVSAQQEGFMNSLTEAARQEINRMNQIFENANVIGVFSDPESKGEATDPAKQGDPFEEKAEAELDKDLKDTADVEDATPDNKEVKDVDDQLKSDEMPKGGESQKDFTDAHDDLEGEGVADQDPKGGKVVMVNEEEEIAGIPEVTDTDEIEDDETLLVDTDLTDDDKPVDFEMTPEEKELDDLLREFMNEDCECCKEDGCEEALTGELIDEKPVVVDQNKDVKDGGEEALTGPHGDLEVQSCDKLNESIDRITDMIWESIKEGQGWNVVKNFAKRRELPTTDKEYDELFVDNAEGIDRWIQDGGSSNGEEYYDKEGDSTPKRYDKNGMRLPKINKGWDGQLGRKTAIGTLKGLSKANILGNKIAKKFAPKQVPGTFTLEETIKRLVKEEIAKLNVFGDHPRYQQEPMTTPPNTEVETKAGKDWNDKSAKGNKPYGEEIGSSAPFIEKVDIEELADKITKVVTESIIAQKKK